MASSICHIACVMQCSGTAHYGIHASACNVTHASTVNAVACMYMHMSIPFNSTIKYCVLQNAHMGVCGWYNAGVGGICLRDVHSVACRYTFVHTCDISNVVLYYCRLRSI